jgi:hypothetical protein
MTFMMNSVCCLEFYFVRLCFYKFCTMLLFLGTPGRYRHDIAYRRAVSLSLHLSNSSSVQAGGEIGALMGLPVCNYGDPSSKLNLFCFMFSVDFLLHFILAVSI